MRFITTATEAPSDFEYVLGYIQMHANEKTTVREIARDLSYNYDYFRHFFLKKTGVNAKEYLLGIKIGNAKQYLETTDYSIKKIAQITGFATPSHFASALRRWSAKLRNSTAATCKSPIFGYALHARGSGPALGLKRLTVCASGGTIFVEPQTADKEFL